jgi:hypothetical protein
MNVVFVNCHALEVFHCKNLASMSLRSLLRIENGESTQIYLYFVNKQSRIDSSQNTQKEIPRASRLDVDAGSKYGFSPILDARIPVRTAPGTKCVSGYQS